MECACYFLNIPHAAEIDAASFHRVGNAPRVRRRGIVFRRTTRASVPTRLNEAVLTARSISAIGCQPLVLPLRAYAQEPLPEPSPPFSGRRDEQEQPSLLFFRKAVWRCLSMT